MEHIQSPRNDEAAIESLLQDLSLKGPRLTPELIDSMIIDHTYHQFPNTTVTVCCLTLTNGFKVVGHSATISKQNFDAEIGKRLAYVSAREKIWELEGYRMHDQIYRAAMLNNLMKG